MNDELEEDYFGPLRKHFRDEKKRAQKKDRSQYKKTDRDKKPAAEKSVLKEGCLRARILSILVQGIRVEAEGKEYLATLRGALKKQKSQQKNWVTVGDWVIIEPQAADEAIILEVEPRTSVLSRADNLNQRKEHLIAANIDQVLITVSVGSPPLRPAIVDRYILAAMKGGLEPVVVINKIDLLTEEEVPLLEALQKAFAEANIPCVLTSTENPETIENLKRLMADHSSVFSGPSGVGKSSLISAITGESLKTKKVVERTQKGSHTTTTTQLYHLQSGGYTVDTPGIKSFGMWNLTKEEIRDFFPDFVTLKKACTYSNCLHLEETGCAVKKAVEEDKVPFFRYESYLNLMRSAMEQHLRR